MDAKDRLAERSGRRQAGGTRLPPVGFWSYARQDDQLSAGRLSALRALLIQELQQQYGREPISLFQDKDTIPLGSDWETEIKRAIDASTFFIPIITPNFVQSDWCCREVELFIDREKALHAEHPELAGASRIFPILFIGIDDADPEDPDILAALQRLQWFDFRRFRHRSFEDVEIREALSELAGTMRSLLKVKVGTSLTPPKDVQPPAAEPEAVEAPEPTTVAEVPAASPEPAPEAPAARTPAPRPARQIDVGDVLNHMFEVKRFIKAGGMGQVFEGSNVITGERVAIKALLPGMAGDPKIVELFQREAATLTRLNHEALVQYRVLAREPEIGALYIVTEFIDGVDLGEALADIDRSAEEIGRLLGRLAAGLAVAHRLGAVHRDISPDNVMLPGGDVHQAKIIDFGIAKDMAGRLPTLIGAGLAGKLNHVAPEQLGEYGGESGPWSDIYSLGLLILAASQGGKLDMSGSFIDAIRKRRDGPDIGIAPEPLRPLLTEMLRPDPADRLRSMEAVIAGLAEAMAPKAAAPEADEATIAAPAPAKAKKAKAATPAPPAPPAPIADEVTRIADAPAVTEATATPVRAETPEKAGAEEDAAGGLSTRLKIGIGLAALAVAILLARLLWPAAAPVAPAPDTPAPAPVAAGPSAAPPAPAAAPPAMGAWLFRRWCYYLTPTSRPVFWSFRPGGENRILVTNLGHELPETVVRQAPDLVETNQATYAYDPGHDVLTVRDGSEPMRLQACR